MSQEEQSANEGASDVRAPSLTSKEAMKTHLLLVVVLALCVLAFWFELGRAERGNGLSWAYVFEWPLLAGFALYMWWKFLHPETKVRKRRPQRESVAPQYAGMLAAWEEEQRKLEEVRRAEEATTTAGERSDDDRTKGQ